jgi:hypothetical protein
MALTPPAPVAKKFKGQIVITTKPGGTSPLRSASTGKAKHAPVVVSHNHPRGPTPPADGGDSSTLINVAGTASLGGTATLTATLTRASGQALSGVAVSFTLDGAFAGVAITDGNGVATLPKIPTSDSRGPDIGGVRAFLAGKINDKSSVGTGDLTVT